MDADPLQSVLARALAKAAQVEADVARIRATRARLAAQAADRVISTDFAARLAERARFRTLLSEERLDGVRFRWYFSHIETTQDLDQLRRWIDAKITATKPIRASAAKTPPSTPTTPTNEGQPK